MDKNRHPIDRGYSWIIVIGASIGMFFVSGSFRSMGIVFLEMLNTFEASQGLTAVVIGVISAGMSILSPFMMALGMRFTMRAVVMSGGLLVTMAALLCSFGPNIYYVIGVFGIFTGAGMACIVPPSLVIVSQYFDKRRSFANGLAMAGASIGQIIFPFFATYLFEEFTFQGAFIIYGALSLHIVIGGALLRPPSFYERENFTPVPKGEGVVTTSLLSVNPREQTGRSSLLKSNSSLNNSTRSLDATDDHVLVGTDTLEIPDSIHQPNSSEYHHRSNEHISTKQNSRPGCFCCVSSNICNSTGQKKCIAYDTQVLKNYLFILYLIGSGVGYCGYLNMIMFIPSRAKDCGLSKEMAALLLSICGGTDFVGRLIGGWFGDLGLVKRSNILGIGLIIASVFGTVCTFVSNFISLTVLSIALGFVGGVFVSLSPVVLRDFVGQDKFPSAFGLQVLFIGLFNLAWPGTFGRIRDVTGSFTVPYLICSAFVSIGGFLFLLEPLARKLQVKNEKVTEDMTIEIN